MDENNCNSYLGDERSCNVCLSTCCYCGGFHSTDAKCDSQKIAEATASKDVIITDLRNQLSIVKDQLKKEHDALVRVREHRERAIEALADLVDLTDEPPEANCSCHISPPCSDCINHSASREALAKARAALVTHTIEHSTVESESDKKQALDESLATIDQFNRFEEAIEYALNFKPQPSDSFGDDLCAICDGEKKVCPGCGNLVTSSEILFDYHGSVCENCRHTNLHD